MFLSPNQFDAGSFWKGVAQGDDPNLPDDPIAAERLRQANAFQASLAKPRQAPPALYKDSQIERGDAPAGSYFDVGNGMARADQLQAHAATGNMDAIDALLRNRKVDAGRNAYNQMMLDRMSTSPEAWNKLPGLGQRTAAAENDVEKAFMQAMGIGNENFKQDTERAKAGIAEFGEKVNAPQKLASEEARAKLGAETELKKAAIGRKAALEAPLAQAAAAKMMDPLATPEEKAAARQTLMGLHQGGTDVSVGSPPGNVKMDGGKPQQIDPLADLKKMEEAGKSGDVQRALVNEALGRVLDPKTGKVGSGSFDPARIAEVISRRGGAMTPEMMQYLVREVRNLGTAHPDQMVSDAFRKYADLSRLAGTGGGNGPFQIEAGPMGKSMFGSGGAMTRFSHPEIGQIMLRETPGNRINVGGFTESQRQKNAQQAQALGSFLEAYLRGGMGQ